MLAFLSHCQREGCCLTPHSWVRGCQCHLLYRHSVDIAAHCTVIDVVVPLWCGWCVCRLSQQFRRDAIFLLLLFILHVLPFAMLAGQMLPLYLQLREKIQPVKNAVDTVFNTSTTGTTTSTTATTTTTTTATTTIIYYIYNITIQLMAPTS